MKNFLLILFAAAVFAQEPEEQGNSQKAILLSTSITDIATSATHVFQNGMVLDNGESYFVSANCNSNTASVTFKLDSEPVLWVHTQPFQSAAMTPAEGKHTMLITPANAGGKAGNTVSVTFSTSPSTPTPTATPTPTTTPTATPSPSPTASPTPTSTPSATPTPSPTPTPSVSPSLTPSPSPSVSPSPSPAYISGLGVWQNGAQVGSLPDYQLTVNTKYTVRVVTATNTTSVKFLRDGTGAATDTSEPYEYTWTPGNVGDHNFQATAFNGTTEGNTIVSGFTVVSSPSTPTPSPTGTPTTTPSPPSPSPTPTPASVTVQIVNPTTGDTYDIYYGRQAGNYGNTVPIPPGQSSVRISGLVPGVAYYFANKVTRGANQSPMSDPVAYTVTTKAQNIGTPLIIALAVVSGIIFIAVRRNQTK